MGSAGWSESSWSRMVMFKPIAWGIAEDVDVRILALARPGLYGLGKIHPIGWFARIRAVPRSGERDGAVPDSRPHRARRRPRGAATQAGPVSYTHLRAHETRHDLVC